MSRQTPAASRQYYLANRERILEYQRERRASNKQAIAEREKAYREANREKRNAQKREHYQQNRDRLLSKAREYRETVDPDAARAYKRAHYEANKEAYRANRERWLKENPERVADYRREYGRANAKAARARARQWRLDNPVRAAEQSRAYAKANPQRLAVHTNRRRARLTDGADLTADQWLQIVAGFEGHCAYCDCDDRPLVMEHMTPLARGGKHTASNVVPACQPCNARKHTKTAFEFAGWDVPPRMLAS